MGIHVSCFNEDETTVSYEFRGKWSWEQFEQALEMGFGLIESVQHPVDVVFDMSKCKKIPDGAMIYWRKMMRVIPENHQHLIFVSSSYTIQNTVKMFREINRRFQGQIILLDTMPSDICVSDCVISA